jgi:hypothetical protein
MGRIWGHPTPSAAMGHRWVNHRMYFVDPADRQVHTQGIEATWGALKSDLRHLHGTNKDLFPTICINICSDDFIQIKKYSNIFLRKFDYSIHYKMQLLMFHFHRCIIFHCFEKLKMNFEE